METIPRALGGFTHFLVGVQCSNAAATLHLIVRDPLAGDEIMMPLDSSFHAPQVRFDLRAERNEYEHLFQHPARVLQDRLARLGGGDRTKHPAMPEWKTVFLLELQAQRLLHQARLSELQAEKLLHQARVLGWGKEKQHYYAQVRSSLDVD